MGFVTYPFTEARRARWIAAGRGTGTGASWNPWLHPGDVPQYQSNLERFICSASGRVAVHFSTFECDVRACYEYARGYRGCDEQFPLDRERTRSIARRLGITHPRDPKSGVDIVITTDLVVHLALPNGQKIRLPRSCKTAGDITNFNQAEHAEIERRYWEEEGDHWKLVLDTQISRTSIENIHLLRPHRFLEPLLKIPGQYDSITGFIKSALQSPSKGTVDQFIRQQAKIHQINLQHVAQAFFHLVFTRQIEFDIDKHSLLEAPIDSLLWHDEK